MPSLRSFALPLAITVWFAACAPEPVRKGDEAFQSGNYEAALTAYQSAKGSGHEVGDRISRTEGKLIEAQSVRASKALDAGDFRTAAAAIAVVHRRWPQHESAKKFEANALQRFTAYCDARVKSGEPAEAWYAAALLMAAVPELAEAATLRDQASLAWEPSLNQARGAAEKEGRVAVALMYEAAYASVRRDKDAGAFVVSQGQKLLEKHQFGMRVDGPKLVRDTAAAVDPKIRMSNRKPSVRLSFRVDAIKSKVDKKKDKRVHEYSDPAVAKKEPKIAAAQADLDSVDVVIKKVDREIDKLARKGTALDASCEKRKKDPTAPACKQAESNRYELDLKTKNKAELAAKRTSLQAAYDAIPIPKAKHEYEVVTHDATYSQKVTVKTTFPELNTPPNTIEKVLEFKASDTTHRGAADKGLEGDPLTLPKRAEVGEKIDALLVDLVREHVSASRVDWRKAAVSYARAQKDPAEALASYVLIDPDGVPEDAAKQLSTMTKLPAAAVFLAAIAKKQVPVPPASMLPAGPPVVGPSVAAPAATPTVASEADGPAPSKSSGPDPLEGHATGRFAVGATTFRVGTRTVLAMSKTGAVRRDSRPWGQISAGGMVGRSGQLIFAIDRGEKVWIPGKNGARTIGTFEGATLKNAESSIAIDSEGHVVVESKTGKRVSKGKFDPVGPDYAKTQVVLAAALAKELEWQ